MTLTQGWHPELTNDQHHNLPAISSSALKVFLDDPNLYYANYVKKSEAPIKPYKKEFKIGTLVHMALLEPQLYSQRVRVCEDGTTTKKYKEFVWNWIGQVNYDDPKNSSGRFYDADGTEYFVVSPEEDFQITAMAKSANRHPLFCAMRENGLAEITGTAKFRETWLSCRGDLRGKYKGRKFFVDIKTIGSYSEKEATDQIFNFGYYISQLHYIHTANLIEGEREYEDFLFFFIEKNYPFRCEFYQLEMNKVEESFLWNRYFRKLNELCHTLETNSWERYQQPTVKLVKIPQWVINK